MTYFNQESDQRLSRQEAFSNSFVTSLQEDEVETKRNDLREVRFPASKAGASPARDTSPQG